MDLTLKQKQIDMIFDAVHPDPFSFLGMHRSINPIRKSEEYAVRVFLPHAESVSITGIKGTGAIVMKKIDRRGFFEGRVPPLLGKTGYRLKITGKDGVIYETYDPYSFGPVMSDFDIYLFSEGSHTNAYSVFGSHLRRIGDAAGVYFALWAPAAKRVSVVGDFNRFDARVHQMRMLGQSGIYEIFIPGLGEGENYCYEICTQDGAVFQKKDPYSFRDTPEYSTVHDISGYKWSDKSWMDRRTSVIAGDRPVSIYECRLESLAEDPSGKDKIEYIGDMGHTHIELMLTEGKSSGFFAAPGRSGDPGLLMSLVDRMHAKGLGVILDWSPGHFPGGPSSLERYDGTSLYEYSDPLRSRYTDKNDLVFDYEKSEVVSFLISNAVFLFEKYHIDGLKIDSISPMIYLDYGRKKNEWMPNKYGGKENIEAVRFIKHLNSVISSLYPDVMMIAESNASYPQVTYPVRKGGLGFTYMWDTEWRDGLFDYLMLDPEARKNRDFIAPAMIGGQSEEIILPLSHDIFEGERKTALQKIPGGRDVRASVTRAVLAYMYCYPGKKLVYAGWSSEQERSPRGKSTGPFMKDLLSIYASHKSLYEADRSPSGFESTRQPDTGDEIVGFIRYSEKRDDFLLCLFNFTNESFEGQRVGVPVKCAYKEILCSGSEAYGGTGVSGHAHITALNTAADKKPYSIEIDMPPMSARILMPVK